MDRSVVVLSFPSPHSDDDDDDDDDVRRSL